jgi:septum formation protein
MFGKLEAPGWGKCVSLLMQVFKSGAPQGSAFAAPEMNPAKESAATEKNLVFTNRTVHERFRSVTAAKHACSHRLRSMSGISMFDLVLASRSPRRSAILSDLGLNAQILPFDIVEDSEAGELASVYVARIARLKQEAAIAHWGALKRSKPSADLPVWILTADTTVVQDERIFGKPAGDAEASEFLERFSGKTHFVQTCFALGNAETQTLVHLETVRTEVEFRVLTALEIARYIASGEPFDKAGGYGIQSGAAHFVRAIRGSYTNVVGLPAAEVIECLRKFGVC